MMSEYTIIDDHVPEIEQKAKPKLSIADVLRFRDFRLLWIGEGISLLGDQFYMVALPLIALAVSGDSGAVLGTLLAVGGIPRAVFMVIGGAVTDRVSPRRILLWSNIVRALMVGILTALVFTNSVAVWHLFVIALVFGISDAFSFPANTAFVPRLVGEDGLEAGNSLVQLTAHLSVFIGPAIAGALIAIVGSGAALAIDTVSFGAAIIALLMMSEVSRIGKQKNDAQEPAESLAQSIGNGLRYVWDDPLLRAVILMVAIVDFSIVGPISVGMPVLAEVRFEAGASGYGLLISAFGGGAILGSLLGGALTFNRRGLLFISMMAVFGAVFVLHGVSPSFVFTLGLNALLGVASGVFNVVGISWLQRRTDPTMIGRVMSLIMLSSVGLQPISNAIAGLLVDANMNLLFFSAGGLILIGTVLMLFNRSLRTLE
jgi:MFS family permease